LCLVLRSRIRRGNDATISGQTLHGALRQSPLPGTADAVHAVLPVVPQQGQETLEIAGQSPQLPGLQVGYRGRILELLRLVQGADTA